jgi:L,D-transpeptidase YcbB
MIRTHFLVLGLCMAALGASQCIAAPHSQFVTDPALSASHVETGDRAGQPPAGPAAQAVRARLDALPPGETAPEIKERVVLSDFYAARGDEPLWVGADGWNDAAKTIAAEFKNSNDWGLDAEAFPLPDLASGLSPEQIADADVTMALTVLKYARYARGGRIIDPTILLNSNLDRKPKLIDPETVISGIAASDAPDDYLRSLHPQHPQFELLRQARLATRSKPLARKLQANMEVWRWMPEDLGDLHIMANVPEYLVYLVKHGKPILTERVVVGELGKQTTIFTRNLKTIVFKPMWRVPESIKVRELLPNLRRGGSMFRQHGLQLETKDGEPLDYRSIDWNSTDIRDYEVVQPPGPKNVMGVVKFTFPSQHTIFMHDTIDKWMFGRRSRMLSHGCLRLRNPMRLAELVLKEDKGWDAAKVEEVMQTGPRNNEVVIDHKIPVHLVYFTAWVDDDGKVRTFGDIYGHEKRIRQALDGKWDQIEVGRNHLAPVQDVKPRASAPVASASRRRSQRSVVDIVGGALNSGF